MPAKDTGITRQPEDKGITVSQSGITIPAGDIPINIQIEATAFAYLVLDCSGSMMGDKINQAIQRSLDFARQARADGYLVGIIQFASEAIHVCEPQRELSLIEQQVSNITAGGTTNMAAAIRMAKQNLKNRKGRRAMVIVTDGMPDSETDALQAATEAKNQGIDIIAIGTDDADQWFLQRIASRPELAKKVTREQLGQAIVDAAKMLPPAR
ncbi:MAG: VWA domain-containing protein [Chloroflexi bacterium]|nr:VWA domain-containing protein [Chloroflexota bacterium]